MAKSGSFAVSNSWSGGSTEIRWSSVGDSSDNESTVKVELWAKTSGFTTYGSGSWVLKIGGSSSTRTNSSVSVSGSWKKMVEWSRTVSHGSDGELSINIGVTSGGVGGTSWTDTSGTKTVALDDFTRLPGKTPTPSVSGITDDYAVVTWSAASSPVSIDYYRVLVELASNGANVYDKNSADRSEGITSGLNPGTNYTVRVLAHSSEGWSSSWSNTRAFTTLPGPTGKPTISSITPTSVTVSWANPSGSISGITGYEYQISTNSSFTAVVGTVSTGVTNSDNTANNMTLTPNTTYYARVRAKVGSSVGLWSSTTSFQTLPSTPPTLAISPAPAGTSSTVTLSPPAGLSNVDSYTVEMRRQGTTTPVTTKTTTGNSVTFTSLAPGVTYEYRASADIGTYTSPFSAWVSRKQPQPSTNPGDYFDGDSPDTENETFEWSGTPNNSTSQVVGEGPLGWYVNPSVAGGACVVTRVVGGYVGDYAARMFVQVAPAAAGMELGQSPETQYGSPVVPGETYYGSMYVSPSKSQRITTMILWRRGDNSVISIDQNEGQVCAVDEWTRVVASGAAPSDAVRASVRVVDTEGDGWSLWEAGDTLLADAAMLTLSDLFPYFDGDTEDSTDYTYEWNGAAHNSDSQRSIVALSTTPIIRDPDCAPLPAAPRPPTIDSDCIAETGTWRRYWTIIPSWEVSDMLYTLPAIRVRTQSAALRQLRVRFYQAPQGEDDPNAIDPNDWVSEMVVSYVPPNSVLTLDSVEEKATITQGNSLPAEAGHLLYGSNGAPVVWPALHCGVNYFVSFETPTNVPIGNQVFEAILTQKY